jgi:DNA-directed RNA polymerase subunit L
MFPRLGKKDSQRNAKGQLLLQGLEADYESRMDDLRQLLAKVLVDDAEVKLAAMRADHDSTMQAEAKRIRVEAQVNHEHELKQMREGILAECEAKIYSNSQSLAEEHSMELQRVRSVLLLEHAENLRIAAIEASQLHAEELELLKKQAADDAERKLASIRENFEITLNSELNRVRSEVSSSSEADMQLAYQQVATEYEAKIESVKKKHEEELQNIRSLHEGDKAQLIEESIAKLNLVNEELSNEAAQKNQDVTDRLNIEWKSKLEDTLNGFPSRLLVIT